MCISWLFSCYITKQLFQPRQITYNFHMNADNHLSVQKPLGFTYHNWSITNPMYFFLISYWYLFYKQVPVLLHSSTLTFWIYLLYRTDTSGNQDRNIFFIYFIHGLILLLGYIMYLFLFFIIVFIIFRDTDGKFPFVHHDL